MTNLRPATGGVIAINFKRKLFDFVTCSVCILHVTLGKFVIGKFSHGINSPKSFIPPFTKPKLEAPPTFKPVGSPPLILLLAIVYLTSVSPSFNFVDVNKIINKLVFRVDKIAYAHYNKCSSGDKKKFHFLRPFLVFCNAARACSTNLSVDHARQVGQML